MRKKKQEVSASKTFELVTEPTTGTPFIKEEISELSIDLGRGDLNQVVEKLNEVIKKFNER